MDNLLPHEEQQRIRKEYRFRSVTVFLILCSMVEFFALVFLAPSFLYSQSKESAAEVRRGNLPVPKDEDERIFSELKSLQGMIFSLQPEYRVVFSKTIDIILSQSEGKVKIDSIKVQSRDPETHEVLIAGRSATRDKLLLFKAELEKVPDVESVSIPISDYAEDTDLNFSSTIIVHYKRS